MGDILQESDIKLLLKSNGLKATPQRVAIYSIMQRIGHASAEDVVEIVRKEYPTVTVATVYNVLEAFAEKGVLSRRFSMDNKMYFDVTTYDHAHFYDKENKCYIDFKDSRLVDMVREYLKSVDTQGFVPEQVEIQILCSRQ